MVGASFHRVCCCFSFVAPPGWRVPALEPPTPGIITHLLLICLTMELYLREQWSCRQCGIVKLEIQLVLSSYSRVFNHSLVGVVNVFYWSVDRTALIVATLVFRVIMETCGGSSTLLNTCTEEESRHLELGEHKLDCCHCFSVKKKKTHFLHCKSPAFRFSFSQCFTDLSVSTNSLPTSKHSLNHLPILQNQSHSLYAISTVCEIPASTPTH